MYVELGRFSAHFRKMHYSALSLVIHHYDSLLSYYLTATSAFLQNFVQLYIAINPSTNSEKMTKSNNKAKAHSPKSTLEEHR